MCFDCIGIVDDPFIKGLKTVQYWDAKFFNEVLYNFEWLLVNRHFLDISDDAMEIFRIGFERLIFFELQIVHYFSELLIGALLFSAINFLIGW